MDLNKDPSSAPMGPPLPEGERFVHLSFLTLFYRKDREEKSFVKDHRLRRGRGIYPFAINVFILCRWWVASNEGSALTFNNYGPSRV
jgi:hypothetical protein